jgi:hypothetical protein
VIASIGVRNVHEEAGSSRQFVEAKPLRPTRHLKVHGGSVDVDRAYEYWVPDEAGRTAPRPCDVKEADVGKFAK